MLKQEGKTDGTIMCKENRTLLSTAKIEDKFHSQLQRMLMVYPGHSEEGQTPEQQIKVLARRLEICNIAGK
eukprot:1800901-Ditylum_brightwellii.AAC.1